MVIWEGKSLLNGDDIVVIATMKTANRKTGNVVQTWILAQDANPVEALKTGQDTAICGSCPFRGILAKQRACYVNVGQAPLAIWNKWHAGKYLSGFPDVTNRIVRLGSYGDPAAVPIEVWDQLITNADGHLGYTHQWKTCSTKYQRLLMASCESEWDAFVAHSRGWRTFRVKLEGTPVRENEIVCPASPAGGLRRTCETCGACDGGNNRRRSIVIDAHGGAGVLPVIKRLLQPELV